MDVFHAVILGAVQGLTEFLPISSSGHLVLFQTIFEMKEPMLAFDIALHGGTLVAILAFFYKEIGDLFLDLLRSAQGLFSKDAKSRLPAPKYPGLWVRILVSLVPTGVLAFSFRDFVEVAFSNLFFVAVAWIVMGCVLLASRKLTRGEKELSGVGYADALWIGLVQGISVLPGVSRSGATILGGRIAGLSKETSAKFSFLMSLPAVLGALILDREGVLEFFAAHPAEMVLGFVSSAITGYLVIKLLMYVVRHGRFYRFGYYSLAVGLFALAYVIFV